MNKRIVLVFIILALIIVNLGFENFQTKLYNTYLSRKDMISVTGQDARFTQSYNLEDEVVKFTYRFLSDWKNNLTTEYLDESFYKEYSNDKKAELIDYLRDFEVADKSNDEVVLVKVGSSKNTVTNKEYVNITYYVAKKEYNYGSDFATEIRGNSPDANKKFSISVYQESPYNFKLRVFLDNGIEGNI